MIMYGRGEKSIAEQLGCSEDEARQIKNNVYNGFPAIKQFEDDSNRMAAEKGYVTTLWGRKRRLPDFQLPPFQFVYMENDYPVPAIEAEPWKNKLMRAANYRKRDAIVQECAANGIRVINNGGKIADAQRQIINSRVQGSAADMSKKAMIAVNTDKELRALKGQVIVPVHDELILKAPLRNARLARELFARDMEHAAEDRLTVPIKCDVTTSFEWYGDELDLDKALEGLYDE